MATTCMSSTPPWQLGDGLGRWVSGGEGAATGDRRPVVTDLPAPQLGAKCEMIERVRRDAFLAVQHEQEEIRRGHVQQGEKDAGVWCGELRRGRGASTTVPHLSTFRSTRMGHT